MADSNLLKALRYATNKVNRENKHPDEPPLVVPGVSPKNSPGYSGSRPPANE